MGLLGKPTILGNPHVFLLVFVSKWLSLILLVRFQHTLKTSIHNWNGRLEHVSPFKHGGFAGIYLKFRKGS